MSGSTLAERIEEVDRMLFEAGMLTWDAKTVAARKAVDDKIMDARVKLQQVAQLVSGSGEGMERWLASRTS